MYTEKRMKCNNIIKGLRPLPPTPVERMDRGSLNRTSTPELPAATEKQCLKVQAGRSAPEAILLKRRPLADAHDFHTLEHVVLDA